MNTNQPEPTPIPTPRTDEAKITNLDAYESHSVVVPFYKMAELERENVVLRKALSRVLPLLPAKADFACRFCMNKDTGNDFVCAYHEGKEALTPPTT